VKGTIYAIVNDEMWKICKFI